MPRVDPCCVKEAEEGIERNFVTSHVHNEECSTQVMLLSIQVACLLPKPAVATAVASPMLLFNPTTFSASQMMFIAPMGECRLFTDQ